MVERISTSATDRVTDVKVLTPSVTYPPAGSQKVAYTVQAHRETPRQDNRRNRH